MALSPHGRRSVLATVVIILAVPCFAVPGEVCHQRVRAKVWSSAPQLTARDASATAATLQTRPHLSR